MQQWWYGVTSENNGKWLSTLELRPLHIKTDRHLIDVPKWHVWIGTVMKHFSTITLEISLKEVSNELRFGYILYDLELVLSLFQALISTYIQIHVTSNLSRANSSFRNFIKWVLQYNLIKMEFNIFICRCTLHFWWCRSGIWPHSTNGICNCTGGRRGWTGACCILVHSRADYSHQHLDGAKVSTQEVGGIAHFHVIPAEVRLHLLPTTPNDPVDGSTSQ